MKLWSKIILLLLIPQICFAQMMLQNRDIKQPAETKLFISSNHLVPDFQDVSSSNNPITKYADAKTVNESSTTNPKYYPVGNDKGIFMDGTQDAIQLASSTDFNFGTGDFTIDMWVRLSTVQNTMFYSTGSGADTANYINFFYNHSNTTVYFQCKTSNTFRAYYSCTFAPVVNTWYHIAVIRTGNTCLLTVNGLTKSVTETTVFNGDISNASKGAAFGINMTDDNYDLLGFMQNIRITKGEALWTSSFIPPSLNSTYMTTANTKLYIKGHDIAVNTVAFTDTATAKNITTFGDTKVGYSRGIAGYFDGTGDYLSAPNSADFDLGSGDFTISGWFYTTNVSASKQLITKGDYNNNTRTFHFDILATSGYPRFAYSYDGTNYTYMISSSAITLSKWHHIAVIRNSGTIDLYLDGVSKHQDTGTSTFSSSAGNLLMGAMLSGLANTYFPGYMSNLIIDKGIARYTSNFTPPETEPVADSYTKLLLKQNMLKIPDIATAKTVTIVGQTAVSKVNNKNGINNIVFDGNGDYLSVADNADFEITNNDFTVDFWVKPALVDTTARYILGKWLTTGNQREWYFSFTTGKKIDFTYSTDGTATAQMLGTSDAVAATWYHVAMCKSSTNIYLFIDGDLKETDTGVASIFGGTSALQIGTANSITATNILNGALSDVRVTKGKALWTANFTPPRRSGAY